MFIGGDANGTLHKNDSTSADNVCPGLVDVVKEFHLTDVWRFLHPVGFQPTYIYQKGASRIDFLL